MKLNNLQIKSFRGATQPVTIEFDKAKKITMIFAENGNGKSTISDAFVCLLTNEKGSLDDKSSIDMRFLKSLGTGTGEASITLDTDAGIFSATLSGTSKSFIKNPIVGIPAIRFLRRNQIINLINAEAAKRYETLKDYIDVSNILTSEDALRKVNKEVEKDLENTTGILSSATTTLEKAWETEGKPDGEMLIWAKAQSEKDLSKENRDYLVLVELIKQWNAIDIKHKEIIVLDGTIKLSLQAKKSSVEILNKLKLENTTNNTELLTLLQNAKTYIVAQEKIESCPVCSSDFEKAVVIASLEKQITSMDALEKAAKILDINTKAHDRNIAIQTSAIATISASIIKYKNSISKYRDKLPEIIPFIDGIDLDVSTNYTCFTDNLSALLILFGKIDEAEKTKRKAIEQHIFIKTQYNSITSSTEKLKKLIKLSKATSKALAIVETERKKFYDNELLSISSEVERMYQILHPDEGLGGIKLFLNPKYKNSLELVANFHSEEGITPQSVYSESHLDTLSICIFLALAKKYSDGNTILVLDDVVMSVDESHLTKFINLLHDEADHFGQIIITTHYRPWKDRYRTHRAPGAKVHFIELRKWSKETGIRVQNGRVELQELELALDDTNYCDRQIIASKSGIILENLLDYLTDIYEYHLPKRKSSKYTLGELIDTLQAKYLKNIKTIHTRKRINESSVVEVFEEEYQLQPVIEELKKLLFIRNQVGAHFNLDQDASDDDVELFGRKSLELGKILICSETGQLPLSKEVDHYKTKNGSVKLFPVEKI
jgi:predicted ATPase